MVFSKFKNILGGKVRKMATGGAPMATDVLDLLKVTFSCYLGEAYGLTEVAGAVAKTRVDDPSSGIVGGPSENVIIRLKDVPDLDYRITDKPNPRGEICIRSP